MPERARALYEAVAEALRAEGLTVATGRFAAHMEVELVNDGPVTFLLRSVAGQVQ
nr:D-aminoacyl-tRNA deacylase [Nannocystis pusilla]